MNITVTGRHLEVTSALKKYATEKIDRMNKYHPNIIDANIILTIEKYRHIAEITILAGGARVIAKEATEDMYSSIDKVLEKVERQLRKHKEKASDYTPHGQQLDKYMEPEETDTGEEEFSFQGEEEFSEEDGPLQGKKLAI